MAKVKKVSGSKRDSAEPKWKTVEKVVALLEKSLSPEARVKHNVHLPSLSTGHEVQCDVVIETGQEPRIVRTIVEVQRRNQRVKPNDFRGWYQKMLDVGANRLICVSALPFPCSIKDQVSKKFGPTVLLVRLEALKAEEWPFQFVNNAIRVYRPKVEVDGSVKPNPLLFFDPKRNPFRADIGDLFRASELPDVIRRDGIAELLPLKDLINEGVRLLSDRPDLNRLPEGVSQVTHHWHPKGVSFCFKGQVAPILSVKIVFKIEARSTLFPVEFLSYTHEGHKASAWAARATGQVDGKDAEIRFICLPQRDGGFLMTRPQLLGIDEGALFFLGYSDQ